MKTTCMLMDATNSADALADFHKKWCYSKQDGNKRNIFLHTANPKKPGREGGREGGVDKLYSMHTTHLTTPHTTCTYLYMHVVYMYSNTCRTCVVCTSKYPHLQQFRLHFLYTSMQLLVRELLINCAKHTC